MSYRERFFAILRNTLIGVGGGVAVAVVIILATGFTNTTDIQALLILGVLIGTIISIGICAKTGSRGFMSSAMLRLFTGIRSLFFSGLTGSAFLLVLGLVRLLLGLAIMIPVILYMAVSYFVNFIYLGIMALIESFAKIDPESTVCTILDKMVSVISIVLVALLCMYYLKISM